MNLNSLIQKIINISIKINTKEKQGFSTKLKIKIACLILFPPLILSIFTNLPFTMLIWSGFTFFIFITLPIILLLNYLISNNEITSKFITDILINDLQITKEEKNIIKDHTKSSDFFFEQEKNKLLLDYLINKNISLIDYNNLE